MLNKCYKSTDKIEQLDDVTSCIYLKVPEKKVVMMQSYFEIYDGVATVRTLDIKNSLICIIVPNCNLDLCFEILESIKKEVEEYLEYMDTEEFQQDSVSCLEEI